MESVIRLTRSPIVVQKVPVSSQVVGSRMSVESEKKPIASLRKKDIVLIDQQPLEVKEIRVSKPGKHGGAKYMVEMRNVFTYKPKQAIFTYRHEIEHVPIQRKEMKLAGVENENWFLIYDCNQIREFKIPGCLQDVLSIYPDFTPKHQNTQQFNTDARTTFGAQIQNFYQTFKHNCIMVTVAVVAGYAAIMGAHSGSQSISFQETANLIQKEAKRQQEEVRRLQKAMNQEQEIQRPRNMGINLVSELGMLKQVSVAQKHKVQEKQALEQMKEKYYSNMPNVPNTLSDRFLCPISNDFMERPMMLTVCGHTFDKKDITKWLLQKQSSCPLCLSKATVKDLIPNFLVADIYSALYDDILTPTECNSKQNEVAIQTEL